MVKIEKFDFVFILTSISSLRGLHPKQAELAFSFYLSERSVVNKLWICGVK
ncbi:MAG: hypothetical protein WB501_06805 [Nitrososphaeraceae archaeon]|jgi:hypothetical protein|nr:hypothetical protein [Nitrososphaeraceae archaeon]MDW0231341.1 hypothetical protein [Nitrososphaeraceae archaeon]MDW0250816.1 hypothetical protein [Nitrososphaeraceae archaeon]